MEHLRPLGAKKLKVEGSRLKGGKIEVEKMGWRAFGVGDRERIVSFFPQSINQRINQTRFNHLNALNERNDPNEPNGPNHLNEQNDQNDPNHLNELNDHNDLNEPNPPNATP